MHLREKIGSDHEEILISESAWEEMTCLFAPSLSRSAVAFIRLTGNMHTHSLHKSAIGGQYRAFRLSFFLLDLVLAGWRYMPFAQETIA
jgi:hypothetical protein